MLVTIKVGVQEATGGIGAGKQTRIERGTRSAVVSEIANVVIIIVDTQLVSISYYDF